MLAFAGMTNMFVKHGPYSIIRSHPGLLNGRRGKRTQIDPRHSRCGARHSGSSPCSLSQDGTRESSQRAEKGYPHDFIARTLVAPDAVAREL